MCIRDSASRFQGSDHTGLSVRLVSIDFVLVGILAMAAATRHYLRTLRLIRRDDFGYIDQRSITVFTAVSLTIIGVVAFVLLVLGSPIS